MTPYEQGAVLGEVFFSELLPLVIGLWIGWKIFCNKKNDEDEEDS